MSKRNKHRLRRAQALVERMRADGRLQALSEKQGGQCAACRQSRDPFTLVTLTPDNAIFRRLVYIKLWICEDCAATHKKNAAGRNQIETAVYNFSMTQ